MKRSMIVLAAATLTTTLAFAAPDGGERGHRGHERGAHGAGMHGDGHRGGMMFDRMAERLDLSEAQKVQMKELHESFRARTEPARTQMHDMMQQLREARAAGDTARAQQLAASLEAQRAQMRQLRESQHERMLALLTGEQRARVEQMKAEREKRRDERRDRRGRRGDERGERGRH